jgi:uncharacterized Zn-binding protein involved in type VI secretion
MPPAARVTDMHTCPMVTGIVPHVGGPILPPGCPTVLIGFLPAARVSDMATCVGPPDVIALGSPTVLIGSMMAARIGDLTAHGGVIVLGLPTVIIGEVGMGSPVIVTPMTPDAGAGASGGVAGAGGASGVANAAGAAASGGAAAGPAPVPGGPQGAALLAAAASGAPFCEH